MKPNTVHTELDHDPKNVFRLSEKRIILTSTEFKKGYSEDNVFCSVTVIFPILWNTVLIERSHTFQDRSTVSDG